ncbi:MAG TPA: hypothetical protein VGD01_13905 [Candidatus Elarobacter sp.]|jgi:hypothetical protein
MRRLVWMLCVLVLAGCAGGGARSVTPPAGDPAGTLPSSGGESSAVADNGGIRLSVKSLQFATTGWSATQIVKTTWKDDSRKAAVSSDPTVAVVSPPYQLATWVSPNTYAASYYVTPVGAGTATITFSDHDGDQHARLNVTVVAPPSGTLYVLAAGEADAFPAAANGRTVPSRRITGFFSSSDPTHSSSAAGAVDVASDGTLEVIKNTQPRAARMGDCYAERYRPDANGNSGFIESLLCNAARGYGVVHSADSELDILEYSYDVKPVVRRFVNAVETSALSVPGTLPIRGGIAVGPTGHLWVATTTQGTTATGNIYEFAAGAGGAATPLRTIAAPSGAEFGAIAAAPDGTLYAVGIVNDGTGGSTATIYAYPPHQTSASRTIGPFTASSVDALAVDKGGELYAGLNARARQWSSVEVYAPDANGAPISVRSIPNPIPFDSGGPPEIIGLALSPADAAYSETTLSRRRR